MDIENDLKALDVLQISILFWRQRGLSDEEIGKKFGNKDAWVEARMGEIYKELGFEPKMHSKEKKKILDEDYLPLVKLLTNDDPDTLKDWPLKAKPIDQNRPKTSQTPPTRRPNKAVDQPRPIPRPFRTWIWIPILLLFVGALYGAYTLGRGGAPQSLPTSAATAIPTSAQVDTPQPSAAPVEITSAPSDIPTVAPSDTSLPSFTPTNTPAPTEPLGFSDDFSNGLNPSWMVEYGSPVIANGQLQASESTLLSVGDTAWTNYKVEFDVKMGNYTCQDEESSTLGVRASDIDNMLLLRFHPCEIEWSSVINGTRKVIPGTYLGNQGFTDTFVHFIVNVEGNKISLHEKSTLLNSFIDNDHPSGKIYLHVRTYTVFDNFKVTLLNP